MSYQASPRRRQELIEGLRDLCEFFERHPDVPLDGWAEITFCVQGPDDEAAINTTQEIATALGVGMTDCHGRPISVDTTIYSAIRRFGVAVSYRATYVTRGDMDDHRAFMSYSGVIKADKTN